MEKPPSERYNLYMKTFVLLFITLGLLTTVVASEAPLRKGDDPARILKLLGEPDGFMKTGKQGIFYYPRGEVHTRNGKVSQIFLISEKEFAAQQAAEEAERATRKAEGEAILAELQANGGLYYLSPQAQLAYWQDFYQKYPEMAVTPEAIQARELAREEAEKEAEAQRLANLEKRVLEAEIRAARAQEEAAKAQQQAALQQNQRNEVRVVYPYYGYYGRRYYGHPVPYKDSYYNRNCNTGLTLSTANRVDWSVNNRIGIRPRTTGDTTLSFRYQ